MRIPDIYLKRGISKVHHDTKHCMKECLSALVEQKKLILKKIRRVIRQKVISKDISVRNVWFKSRRLCNILVKECAG